jgi:uncharacterized membrane protein YhaH (DUF805 family)
MDFSYYLDPIQNHYFDFQGVTGRKAYWMFVLINFLISLALAIVLAIVHLGPLGGLYSLAVLLPGLGIGVRRMHDTGKSGWWLLVAFIPLVGWIWAIYLLCQPSTAPYVGKA